MAASGEIIDTQTLSGDPATDGVDVSGADTNADTPTPAHQRYDGIGLYTGERRRSGCLPHISTKQYLEPTPQSRTSGLACGACSHPHIHACLCFFQPSCGIVTIYIPPPTATFTRSCIARSAPSTSLFRARCGRGWEIDTDNYHRNEHNKITTDPYTPPVLK